VLGLVVLITTGGLQAVLSAQRGYRHAVEVAAEIGRIVLVVAITLLVIDLGAMIVYTLRRGMPDRRVGAIVTERHPLCASLGLAPSAGVSKLKMLYGKGADIPMETLVNGSATAAERMMVRSIVTLFIAFFLVFVGCGLMVAEQLLVGALSPVVPGLWVYARLHEAWNDYRQAKKRGASRSAKASEMAPRLADVKE